MSTTENIAVVDWASVERDGAETAPIVYGPLRARRGLALFSDLDQVTRCMPGAHLTKPVQDGRAEGVVNVKLGPIVGAFSGVLDITRDDGRFSWAWLRGVGS